MVYLRRITGVLLMIMGVLLITTALSAQPAAVSVADPPCAVCW